MGNDARTGAYKIDIEMVIFKIACYIILQVKVFQEEYGFSI